MTVMHYAVSVALKRALRPNPHNLHARLKQQARMWWYMYIFLFSFPFLFYPDAWRVINDTMGYIDTFQWVENPSWTRWRRYMSFVCTAINHSENATNGAMLIILYVCMLTWDVGVLWYEVPCSNLVPNYSRAVLNIYQKKNCTLEWWVRMILMNFDCVCLIFFFYMKILYLALNVHIIIQLLLLEEYYMGFFILDC